MNTPGTPEPTTPSSSMQSVALVDAARMRDPEAAEAAARSGSAAGFAALLVDADDVDADIAATADLPQVSALARRCRDAGTPLLLDARIDRFAPDAEPVRRWPALFRHTQWRHGDAPPDPRRPTPLQPGAAVARIDEMQAADARLQPLLDWWRERLEALLDGGVAGFRFRQPQVLGAAQWRALLSTLPSRAVKLAWTPGLDAAASAALTGAGFTHVADSLPWWDFRAGWWFEERERLAQVAPVLSPVLAPHGVRGDLDATALLRQLRFAAEISDAVLVSLADIERAGIDADMLAAANVRLALRDRVPAVTLRRLTTPSSPMLALLARPRDPGATDARLLLANADPDHVAPVAEAQIARALGDWSELDPDGDHGRSLPGALEPGEVTAFAARIPAPIRRAARGRGDARRAATAARVAIEDVTPRVDDGRFAVRRRVGETVTVEADVFSDGHEKLAAVIVWRSADGHSRGEAPMRQLGNDRWRGEFRPDRVGRYHYTVEAWRDDFSTLRGDLEKKRLAGTLEPIDLREGAEYVRDVAASAQDVDDTTAAALQGAVAALEAATRDGDADPEAICDVLLSPALAVAMTRADTRHFAARSPELRLEAEREAAAFASWYELFPRSASGDVNRHGTFDDVIARLPDIAAMGFDVLYMPPIHPIGSRNRKGRNNNVTAQPGEPGSPYAIGSDDGGHDALHPELGTFDDFARLRDAAAAHGLEIALDFAIQCSPDHPWLREHPEWFDWRADGSLRYAENPPKKYQDIVNVDFYHSGAVPDLWIALRDVVRFWIDRGVRLFRVDNPHTKPYPFWEWMIDDIRSRDPSVVFLSEAFTRPRPMYRLAKLGFSQSYTYFTWRNDKHELTDYLRELAEGPPREFFRPHFFVNTPDINPTFLQTGGRPAHLIRAALATTLSGLWGMYSGFELCEATPLAPGKEEYLDSEKYQLRAWDWDRPGNIVAEITRLNALRRLNPELRTHLNVRFFNAWNDRILYFGKSLPGAPASVLVAVNLDPHAAQEADFEVPLWEWGLPDHAAVQVENLWDGTRFTWRGKVQHLRLDTGLPFALWRIAPETPA